MCMEKPLFYGLSATFYKLHDEFPHNYRPLILFVWIHGVHLLALDILVPSLNCRLSIDLVDRCESIDNFQSGEGTAIR